MARYLLLLTVLGLALAARPSPADTAPARDLVYVIPVNGMIERGLLYAFRRGLQEAEANGASAVILDMDTPGGKLESAEEMVLMLLQAPMRTYTFVHPRAFSAGAIIAMATDEIYMTPVGLIGDAMPIMMSPLPFGGAQSVPADLKEKIMSPTIALVRSAAQAKGHDPLLGEAMVRPEAGYKIGDRVICPVGQLLTLTAIDAAEPLREGNKPLLSSGTVRTMEELLAAIGRANSEVRVVSITPAERIARVIEGFPLSGILLALGLLGLYVEFKTPGFGFPGIGGILCLLIWFWGHHIAGLTGIVELALFATGIGLILLEVFVLPGFGMAGAGGLICVVAAILFSMVRANPAPPPTIDFPLTFRADMWASSFMTLSGALLTTFVLGLIITRFLPKTNAFQRVALGAEVSAAAGFQASITDTSLAGQRGVAVTALRPGGIAEIGGRRLTVVTHGTFVEAGSPIVVAESRGNRIVVETV